MEGRKLLSDVTWMRKKIENLSSTISSMKHNEESSNMHTKMNFDIGKYIQNQEFYDSCKHYNKEIFEVNKRLDEYKRLYDDLSLMVKNKVSDKDMKNLESI